MADSTITLRVVGDTAKAPAAPQAPAPQPSGNAPANTPHPPGNAPANAGTSLAGQIGTLAAGWGAQQLVGSLSGALATLPGRQREANWLGNVGGGLIAGAAPRDGWVSLFSDINEAALKAVRSLLGLSDATTQSADKIQREIDKIEQVRLSQAIRVSVRRQDEAFKKSLAPMTRGQRLDAIVGRMTQLAHGKGEISVDNLDAKLKDMAFAGKSGTAEYKATFDIYKTQIGRLGHLASLYDQTEATPPITPLAPAEVTDALAKRGGTVGPSVDVADVNKDILAVLKDIYRLWEVRASHPDTLDTRGAQVAVLR